MTTSSSTTITLELNGVGAVPLQYTDQGAGRPILLLHGGGGPATVTGYADHLAATREARVITPIHPGFGGTPRPEGLTTIAQLGLLYAQLCTDLGLSGVTVVGNSIGGWVAAESALTGSAAVTRVVFVDAVGIEVPGQPVADFFALTPQQVAEHAYYEPDKFVLDPTAVPPAAQAQLAGNRAALAIYAGSGMADPTLAGRLGGVRTPTLVLWGEADRIAGPAYGRAFADAIPGARFELLSRTGHLPQLETPDRLTDALWPFVA